jgi:hypothetical protein
MMFNFNFNPKKCTLALTTWTLEKIFLIDISLEVQNHRIIHYTVETETTPRLHKRSVLRTRTQYCVRHEIHTGHKNIKKVNLKASDAKSNILNIKFFPPLFCMQKIREESKLFLQSKR